MGRDRMRPLADPSSVLGPAAWDTPQGHSRSSQGPSRAPISVAFHPQPPLHPTGATHWRGAQTWPTSAPAACIPVGQGTASGQSRRQRKFLGEFSSSWCMQGPCSHCVCAWDQPWCELMPAPPGLRVPVPDAALTKAPSPGVPGRLGGCCWFPGRGWGAGKERELPWARARLGWDVFLPAIAPGIRLPLGLEKNASAGTAGWVMAHPIRESLAASAGPGSCRRCWICRAPSWHLVDGPGPEAGSRSKPHMRCMGIQSLGAASSLGCPNPEQWDRL